MPTVAAPRPMRRESTAQSHWPLERILFLLAGTMTGLSALLSAFVSPWFMLLTGFVAFNQLLFVTVGDCPASLDPASRLRRPARVPPMSDPGPIGRLGRFAAERRRAGLRRLGRDRRRPRPARAAGRDARSPAPAGRPTAPSRSPLAKRSTAPSPAPAPTRSRSPSTPSDSPPAPPAFRRTVARARRLLAASPAVSTVDSAPPRPLDLRATATPP